MATDLLLRLLTAHLLTDFLFQPVSWVADRKKNKARSVSLIWHVLLTAVIAYLFSGLYSCWWLPFVILVTHYLIDLMKSYFPDNIYTFLADQVLHLLVIMIIWLIIDRQLNPLLASIQELAGNHRFWLLSFGYVLVTWPLGILIGIATTKWRDELAATQSAKDGLANAGKWIGICERALIFTFVLTSQFTAIGFLLTAKSILRFGEKNAEKKTEYILVGTLLSFGASALLGVIISYFIR